MAHLRSNKSETLRKKKIVALFLHWLNIMHIVQWFFQLIERVVMEDIESNFVQRQLYMLDVGWDSVWKTVIVEKPMCEAYVKSHREAIPFKTKAFPCYDDLCMVFGKDRATGRGFETAADVVKEIEKERGDDINIDDDCINCIHNMMGVDETQSMSFSQVSAIPQSQGSSKKKRKSTNNAEAYEAIKESFSLLAGVIEKASERLSRAIGEDMMEKHSRIRDELQRTTTINTMERHKVAHMMIKDDALVSYFFSIPDDERDEWARALLAGDI